MALNGEKYITWKGAVLVTVAILGILVTSSIFGATQVIEVDKRSNDRDCKLGEAIVSLLKENAEAHTRIMVDLQEIKTKVVHNGNSRNMGM